MKKALVALLILLAVLGIIERLFQSHWGKEIASNLLKESLEDTGFSVAIEKIEGTLPFAMVLKGVSFQSETLSIFIDSLELDLSLLGLLKKELIFTEFKGRGIRWVEKETAAAHPFHFKKEIPFGINISHFQLQEVEIPRLGKANFEGRLSFKKRKGLFFDTRIEGADFPKTIVHAALKIKPDRKMSVKADLTAPFDGEEPFFLKIEGEGRISDRWSIEQADLRLASDRIQGEIHLSSVENLLQGEAAIRLPHFLIDSIEIQSIGTHTQFSWDGQTLKGDSVGSAELFSKIWTGRTDFSWSRGGSLLLPHWDLRSASIAMQGALEIDKDRDLLGQLEANIENLQDVGSDFYGSCQFKIQWKEKEEMEIDGHLSNFYWKDLFSQSISFYSDMKSPLQKAAGNLYLEIEYLKWRSLFLETTSLEIASNEQGLYPFRLFTEGEWKHPLQLSLEGILHPMHPQFLCELQSGKGLFFNHPIVLSHPVSLTAGPTAFHLEPFDMNVADAHLFMQIDRNLDDLSAHLLLENFPLDVLSLNPLDLAIEGRTYIQLDLEEKSKKISGNFKASIDQLAIASLEKRDLINASGVFQGNFTQDRLHLKGGLDSSQAPLLSCMLSLPIHLELWPMKANLLYHNPVKGDLIFNGRIEEILDFFDLGTHYLSGNCTADFHLSQLLEHPHLEGYCHIENGRYENYLTGTQIDAIEADWRGDQGHLILDSFKGTDGVKKGQCTATGDITLSALDAFPFHFDVDFKRFTSLQLDLITADANGRLQIDGNIKSATAQGNLEIVESDLLIPSRIPRSFPQLEVVYLNATKPSPLPQLSKSSSYPLHLNVSVAAPDSIFITGRGLDSEWRGDFQIGGTNTAVEAKGKLELIKGNFVISGRAFQLTEGTLLFTGKKADMPYLNLAGAMNIKDVSIIARLKGPLNDPQITLQSTPPLPLSTIMAYLLFGQDLAEINSYQALQLANSLASLAGEGPDILESTRRSLGVDRLSIVTVSAPDEVGDRIALQVGKYISEGILVSFSQGAENSSSNISIEIELKNGFVLQLESDQQQEQGKFTFKWNHLY
jgi:hypothetical protein